MISAPPRAAAHLPLVVGAGRVRLVEVRRAVVVEAADQTRDAERPASVALRVALLQGGHVARDVLQGDRVLHGQTVRLALEPRPADQDPRVGGQTCRRKRRGG